MTVDAINSATLLDRAAAVWAESRAARRDALLEVGRLLGAFVLTRLREGDSLTEADRLAAGHTRQHATAAAAGRLGISRDRVNELVATARAVDLLRPGGDLGPLSWGALRPFRRCVERTTGHRQARQQVSATEEWHVKPACLPWAAGLLASAVAGGWDERRVRQELRQRLVRGGTGRPRQRHRSPAEAYTPACHGFEPADPEPFVTLRRVAVLSTPPDLADLLCQLVQQSRDPAAVERLLLERLARRPVCARTGAVGANDPEGD